MKNRKFAFVLLFFQLIFVFTISGCAKKEEKNFFDSVELQIGSEMENSETIKEQDNQKDSSQFHVLNLPEHWYNFGIYAKRWAAVVIVGSIVTGWVIFDVFKKNREVQKWAFGLMILRIPVFTFILVYLYAFLYRMLNL